jgi:hypothetical protein
VSLEVPDARAVNGVWLSRLGAPTVAVQFAFAHSALTAVCAVGSEVIGQNGCTFALVIRYEFASRLGGQASIPEGHARK